MHRWSQTSGISCFKHVGTRNLHAAEPTTGGSTAPYGLGARCGGARHERGVPCGAPRGSAPARWLGRWEMDVRSALERLGKRRLDETEFES